MTFELRPLWYGPEPNYERPLAAELNADSYGSANDGVYPCEVMQARIRRTLRRPR